MYITAFLTGIGLSMDAFAVAVCKGLKMQRINWKQLFLIALFFGAFQALMPILGYWLGASFKEYIESFDHWIAFALLAFIGGKMALEAFEKDNNEDCCCTFDIKELFILSIATSIDALAVGIAFAMDDIEIFSAAAIIGITTFILSAMGVFIGHKFGSAFKSKAELAGGIILILIGVKILFEHLEII